MDTAIKVVGPSPKTVKEYSKAILAILNSKAEQETIRMALDVLNTGVRNNTTINDCTFTGK